MNRLHTSTRVWILACITVVWFAAGNTFAGEPADESQRAKLVFLADTKPVLLHVDVLVDGKPVHKLNEAFYKRWFEFLDRDGSAALNASEAAMAPSDQTIRRLIQTGFYFPYKGVSLDKTAKKNDNGEIAWPAFYAFYRNLTAPIQITVGNSSNRYSRVAAPPSQDAGKEIFAKLDANRDGKLSKTEVDQASAALAFFDLSDDELITAEEIAGVNSTASNYYRIISARQASSQPATGRLADGAFYFLRSNDVNSALGLLLLSQYDGNFDKTVARDEIGMSKTSFASIDDNADGKLDAKELSSWHRRQPDATMTVRLGNAGAKSRLELQFAEKDGAPSVDRLGNGLLALELGDAKIRIAGESGKGSQMMMVGQSRTRYYLQQFKKLAKNRPFVEKKDLNTPQARVLSQLFPIVDQNQDGKMTDDELTIFLVLVERGPKGTVNLSITPKGRQLFRNLDADANGTLSIRELRSAWKRLQKNDRNGDGAVALNEIVRKYEMAFARGRTGFGGGGGVVVNRAGSFPRITPKRNVKRGPAWFEKMDRNGDRDLSPLEFLGSPAIFDQIDANRDRLIDVNEAQEADKILRK